MDFLKPTSVYDPDRFNLDRELLRRYYIKNGYADMRVVSAVADVDREGKGFFLTFTVDEGAQLRLRQQSTSKRRCLSSTLAMLVASF